MTFPRAWAEVAGQAVPWQYLLKSQVDNNLYFAADSAEITFKNDTYLSDFLRKQQEVKVWFGLVTDPTRWSRDELTHIFTGQIDGVLPTFSKGMVVKIMCRDYSAPLIDSSFTGTWQNLTTSELATRLFRARGLNPVVTSTETTIDQEMVRDRREWEILQAMAERDGFIAYVDKDRNGYYGPRKGEDEIAVAQLRYRQGPGSNVIEMGFDDSTIGVYNRVVVRHYTGRNGGYVEGVAEDQDLIDRYGLQQKVIHVAAAKTPAIAKQIAESKLQLYRRTAVTGRGIVVGNPGLRAESKLQVSGFGRFDGPYYINRARHTLDKIAGYEVDIDVASLRPDNAFQYRSDLERERGQTSL